MVLTSPQPSSQPPSLSRFLVPAKICVNTMTLPLQVLIDFGAEDSFLDRELAEQLGLCLEPLDEPLTAYAINGQ